MKRYALLLLLFVATVTFAGITPPGMTDPRVALNAAQAQNLAAWKSAIAACPTSPVLERENCQQIATGAKVNANALALEAYMQALPAWMDAVNQAFAAWRAEDQRCKTLPDHAARNACKQANDTKYGKS